MTLAVAHEHAINGADMCFLIAALASEGAGRDEMHFTSACAQRERDDSYCDLRAESGAVGG